LVYVVEHGLVHAADDLHRGAELVELIGGGEAHRALQVAAVGDLHDHQAGVLDVVRAQPAYLRAVILLLNGELQGPGLHSRVAVHVLVVILAPPCQHLPCSVLRALLDEVDLVVLGHLGDRYGLQAFGAEPLGMTDDLAHFIHRDIQLE
jgi:hypothetical protein